MSTNKYDNLFGKDRDWIEETLRDYDVPDGVIMQIGAHFCVMQQQLDKKANKRDVFAEIAEEADREEESRSSRVKAAEQSLMKEIDVYFDGIIAASEVDDLDRPIQRAKRITSLKHQIPSYKVTRKFIAAIWPEGMPVVYNLLRQAQRNSWTLAKYASYTRSGENLVMYVNGVEQRTITIKEFLLNMCYEERRKLMKKMLKNMQRQHDRKMRKNS